MNNRFCTLCAKTRLSDWYAAMVAATRCQKCKTQKIAPQIYDGIKNNRFCKSCSRSEQPAWYAGYVAATRCQKCKTRKTQNQTLDGLKNTRLCISCSRSELPAWYAAYVARHACKTPLCDTFGSTCFKGFCAPCFVSLHPDTPLAKRLKHKEREMVTRVKERYSQFEWKFDKCVAGLGPRPDAMPSSGRVALPAAFEDMALDLCAARSEPSLRLFCILCLRYSQQSAHFTPLAARTTSSVIGTGRASRSASRRRRRGAGRASRCLSSCGSTRQPRFTPTRAFPRARPAHPVARPCSSRLFTPPHTQDSYTDATGVKVASCWSRCPKTGNPRIAPKLTA